MNKYGVVAFLMIVALSLNINASQNEKIIIEKIGPLNMKFTSEQIMTEKVDSDLTAYIVGECTSGRLDTSIATDGQGRVHILYTSPDGRLYYVKKSGNDWSLNRELNVTKYNNYYGGDNSIVADNNHHIHVSLSYSDWADEDLIYLTNSNGDWVASKADCPSSESVGLENDIALDQNGKAYISHWRWNDGALLFTTNTDGTWKTSTIVSKGVQWEASSILLDKNQVPHVFYSDSNSVKHVIYSNGNWSGETIPLTLGNGVSAVVDPNDTLYVLNSRGLATKKSGKSWSSQNIFSLFPQISGMSIYIDEDSMAVDEQGYLHIAFLASIYKSINSIYYASNITGNWKLKLIDSEENRNYYDEAPCISVDKSGNVHLVYSKYTDCKVRYVTFPSEENYAKLSIDHSHLNFGSTLLNPISSAQEVFISNNGTGSLNWTATPSTDWIHVNPSSGTGNGKMSIYADATGFAAGTYTGTVTIFAPFSFNSPQSVTVSLKVYDNSTPTVPFGEFSSPVEGGVLSSSFPVTGWALDNIGISNVKIYNGTDYIGDAVFIEGARPDVEAAFPNTPNNYKAGWGYMLLSYFLPGGGNGVYTLYAKATDVEGNETTLGSKTITIDNAHAAKPFGAIDTPSQGGSASGTSYLNWGWALTPQPNCIPIDGSTISVSVDGVNLGHPVYNVYREDIGGYFPDYLNSNGAVGYFFLDTTTYGNGIHTISWNVTDNAGNSDGIGSRYFMIDNTSHGSSPVPIQNKEGMVDFTQLEKMPIDREPIRVRLGLNEQSTVQSIHTDNWGYYVTSIKELENIQINLKGENPNVSEYSGYVLSGRRLKPLPIGSTLDRSQGLFSWQPGVGFIGKYYLVFVVKNSEGESIRKHIIIEIKPK